MSAKDVVRVEILQNNTLIPCSVEFSDKKWKEASKVQVTFTVRRAGSYFIAIFANGRLSGSSPFKKTFLPGWSWLSSTCVMFKFVLD